MNNLNNLNEEENDFNDIDNNLSGYLKNKFYENFENPLTEEIDSFDKSEHQLAASNTFQVIVFLFINEKLYIKINF